MIPRDFSVVDSDSSSTTTAQGGASETSVDAAKVSSSALSSSSTTSETDSRLRSILSGEQTIRLHMQFLIKNNHTDMLVLKQLKESVRTASAHNATVIANGLMHCGTTCDDFLRDNLDWISKATNWNKFNAVATLGLIHKGHEGNAMKLLEPYLPKGEADPFGFKEGGSLYALGLVHANHGNPTVVAYLKDQLSKATASAVRHGACLGLGLAAMGSHDDTVYKQLRDCLYQDDAVVGEAAGLAMGLVMVASLHEGAFDEMCQYVCDTQHDKIQRGLRTGLALLAYGRMEEVETWVARLLEHKSNPMLRQTGVCLLAMAYAGSGNASVVRRLLAKVAADPNADVKRFAVIAVGFVLSNDPEQCLNYTAMLGEHFNGHVRYGAAMAVGIACAGSGYKEAIALLEPMLAAKENFVRQGAVIALSFVLIQQTEATCPKVSEFRRTLAKMVGEKGEDSITKFGAILAQGLIDAGGRNVTISLHNRTGHADMPGVVGTFVFLQHWYWHSLAHFVSLAFRPSCVIGLNKNLDMPKMEFRSNAKPSMFAYPPALEEKKKEESEKVETAVLSITNKKRLPPVATPATPSSTIPTTPIEDMDVDNAASLPRVDDQPRKEMEAAFVLLANPARVLRLQLKCLTMPENCRYKPLKPLAQGGVILMRDRRGDQVEEVVATVVGGGGSAAGAAVSDVEAQPPAAFEYVIANY